MPDQFDSAIALQESLSDVLTKWPLYRMFVYIGKNCHSDTSGAYGQIKRLGMLPKQIRLFCGHKACGYETLWEIPDAKLYFASDFINLKQYTCRNCGKTTVAMDKTPPIGLEKMLAYARSRAAENAARV